MMEIFKQWYKYDVSKNDQKTLYNCIILILNRINS